MSCEAANISYDNSRFTDLPWDQFLLELRDKTKTELITWFEEFDTDLLLPWNEFLPMIIKGIKSRFKNFKGNSLKDLREYSKTQNQEEYIYAIISVIQDLLAHENKKLETHSKNVSNVAREILANLEKNGTYVSENDQINIFAGAAIHDFGKLTWPQHMFENGKKYGDAENQMKPDHVWNGYYLAVALGLPTDVCEIVLRHHQKNGTNQGPTSNYPVEVPNWVRVDGPEEPDLPEYGPSLHLRIAMAADTVVTMIEGRYSEASTNTKVIDELNGHINFFGGDVVKATIEVINSPELDKVWIDKNV